MVHIVVVQGSMRKDSRTALAIKAVVEYLKEKEIDHDVIDLRETNMEFCDGRDISEYSEETQALYARMKKADGYIVGMPVYQTTVAGPLKNFIDVVNTAMYYKSVGLVVNSGGVRGYLAGADMLKILSYELWGIMVQPTIHTWTKDFEDGKLANEKVIEKIPLMVENVIRYSKVDPAKP